MSDHIHIALHVEPEADASLHVDDVDDLGLTLAERFDAAGAHYEGSYDVYPSTSDQTLDTDGRKLLDDVTVHAVPLQEKHVTKAISGATVYEPDEGYMGLSKITVGSPASTITPSAVDEYATVGGVLKWRYKPQATATAGMAVGGTRYGSYETFDAIAATTVTPSTSQQVIGGPNTMMQGAVTVDAMPTGSQGAASATREKRDGKLYTTVSFPNFQAGYVASLSPVMTSLTLESKSATPSTSTQTVTPTSDAHYLDSVTVDPIPSQYIVPTGNKSIASNGSNIDVAQYATVDVAVPSSSPNLQSKSKSYTPDTTQQIETITADNGYDGLSSVNITVDGMGWAIIDSNSSEQRYITQNGQRKWQTHASFEIEPDGYISNGANNLDWDTYNAVPANTTIIPSTSSQTVGGANYMMEGAVTVAAMPSGTEGTPTATKGAVSNHSVSVTPSVTNSAGYIGGGTHSGTAVSVSASELVSGTKSITTNGTAIDVTNYAAVDVAVPSSSPSLQSKTKSYTPTTSQQSETVSADGGYDGLSSVAITVAAMPSGSVTAPSTITGTSATVSTGTNTLTLTKTISVTPNVTTAGYVSSGTAGNSNVSLTASVTTQAAQTIHPSTTQQTIASGRYLTGTQTIAPVTTTNLTADNIKSGVTVKVGDASDDDRVISVTGTYSGGGSSKAIYIYEGLAERKANSYGATNAKVTVAKAGTYTISYVAIRGSSSGTMGTNLHIGSTTGTNNQTFNNGTYGQYVKLTGQTISANTTVTIYATSGSTSRSLYVGQLVVQEE